MFRTETIKFITLNNWLVDDSLYFKLGYLESEEWLCYDKFIEDAINFLIHDLSQETRRRVVYEIYVLNEKFNNCNNSWI